MNLRLKNIHFHASRAELDNLSGGLLLISTINAHSYNVARKDKEFSKALLNSDVILPDGVSIVLAKRFLNGEQITKIAGWDLFVWEMGRLESRAKNSEPLKEIPRNSSVLFLGSTEAVLAKIKSRAALEYPNIEVHTYSPPYKPEFSDEDNAAIIAVINAVNPDVLFVGMTAPKQEKWAYKLVNNQQLTVHNNKITKEVYSEDTANSKLNCHVCCIGAVFDFYAGTIQRAPLWWQKRGLEWLYRLIKEPRRMWRRYIIGNMKFVWYMLEEKLLR